MKQEVANWRGYEGGKPKHLKRPNHGGRVHHEHVDSVQCGRTGGPCRNDNPFKGFPRGYYFVAGQRVA